MYNNAMNPNTDDYGVSEMNSIFDLDALNRGFFEAGLGACQGKRAVSDSLCGTTGQGIPTVSSNYMPTAFPSAAPPSMNSNPTAYMSEAVPFAAANKVLDTTATSNPLYPIVPDSSPSMPVTPPRHTNFNPYAELLRGSSGGTPTPAAPNMPNPGTLSVNPAFEQYGNQPHTGMAPPLMMPNAVPPFPIGLNYPSGKRKNMKTTAYEIMDDLISRLPIFTHKQTVYIYDEAGGYYTDDKITIGKRRTKSIDSFTYIDRLAQLRPRDYIEYIRQCADLALKRGEERISGQIVKYNNREFSKYLLEEIRDEAHSALPEFDAVIALLPIIRKQVFTSAEFTTVYDSEVAKGSINGAINATKVLELLFEYGVIGNNPRVKGKSIFRYEYSNANLNQQENIIIHRGLYGALQIF